MDRKTLLKEDLFRSSIKFVKPLNSNLKCILCKELLRRPKQTNCGHRVCGDCLETMKEHSPNAPPRCPVDDTELVLKDIFHDRCCERDILMLQCLCLNSKKGCSWLGDLADLKEHVSNCDFTMVKCPNENCKETMAKRHLEDHVKNTCQYRLQTCEKCKDEVALANMKKHLSLCPGISVQCTLGCGASLLRRDMEKHLTTECLNAPMHCPFQQYGCDFKGSRGDLEKHNEENLSKHIQIMGEKSSKYVENTTKLEEKIKNLESENDHLVGQVQASREALALTKQDFQTMQIKLGIMEKHLEQQKTNMEQLKETLQSQQNQTESETAIECQLTEIVSLVQNQEKKINDLVQEQERFRAGATSFGYVSNSERHLDRNEHMCATSEVQMAEHDLRIQMLEATSYDGSYLWKIDDWPRRFREAQIGKTASLYSPPFHVGRYGYKVCGRLYPCGDGLGKGTHISMFFVVMKGEYDSILPWPFRQKVTFKLIDPNRLNDITDTFRPDPSSTSFQKPRGSMNIASGTPKFVSHNILTTGGYIVDNTLFIKISVDRSGLVDL